MSSAAAREMQGKVARIIFDAGGLITSKTIDGAGHNLWSYTINGHEKSFHFAKTPPSRGKGIENTYARLRREIREVKALPPIEPVRPEPVEEERPEPLVAKLVKPTPPAPNKPSRKEMVKAFLSLPSLEAFMNKFGLGRQAAQTMILSSRGQSAQKLRKELNLARAEAARKARERKVERTRKPKLSKKEIDKRDRLIYVYCQFGLSFKDAAGLYNLTPERVRQIVRREESR